MQKGTFMADTDTAEGTEIADLEARLSIYRMMQEGRLFEERARDLFLKDW